MKWLAFVFCRNLTHFRLSLHLISVLYTCEISFTLVTDVDKKKTTFTISFLLYNFGKSKCSETSGSFIVFWIVDACIALFNLIDITVVVIQKCWLNRSNCKTKLEYAFRAIQGTQTAQIILTPNSCISNYKNMVICLCFGIGTVANK